MCFHLRATRPEFETLGNGDLDAAARLTRSREHDRSKRKGRASAPLRHQVTRTFLKGIRNTLTDDREMFAMPLVEIQSVMNQPILTNFIDLSNAHERHIAQWLEYTHDRIE